MRKELDDALVRDFPLTFRDRNADMRVTCMCWGFDVGDGWEPLIRRAAEKIEAAIRKLPEPDRLNVTASQCKEKFGTLRLYMTSQNVEITTAIDEACRESGKTCETCGGAGTHRTDGWQRTLCDPCEATYRANRAARK